MNTYELSVQGYQAFYKDFLVKSEENDKEYVSYVLGEEIDDEMFSDMKEGLKMMQEESDAGNGFVYSCDTINNICEANNDDFWMSHYYNTELKTFFMKPFIEKSVLQKGEFAQLNIVNYNKVQNPINLKINGAFFNSLDEGSISQEINDFLIKKDDNILSINFDTSWEELAEDFVVTFRLVTLSSTGKEKEQEILVIKESDLVDGVFTKDLILDISMD